VGQFARLLSNARGWHHCPLTIDHRVHLAPVLIHHTAEGGIVQDRTGHAHGRQGLEVKPTACFFSVSPPWPVLQMSDEHSDCTFLASSIVPLSELDGWRPSQASSHTTSNCGCCAPFQASSSFKLPLRLPSTSAPRCAANPPYSCELECRDPIAHL
jgi:hypothetical protein